MGETEYVIVADWIKVQIARSPGVVSTYLDWETVDFDSSLNLPIIFIWPSVASKIQKLKNDAGCWTYEDNCQMWKRVGRVSETE